METEFTSATFASCYHSVWCVCFDFYSVSMWNLYRIGGRWFYLQKQQLWAHMGNRFHSYLLLHRGRYAWDAIQPVHHLSSWNDVSMTIQPPITTSPKIVWMLTLASGRWCSTPCEYSRLIAKYLGVWQWCRLRWCKNDDLHSRGSSSHHHPSNELCATVRHGFTRVVVKIKKV